MRYYEYVLCVYGKHVILNENSLCDCLMNGDWWQEDFYLPFFLDDLDVLEEIIKKAYRKHYYSLFSWGFDNQIFFNNDGERTEVGNVMFFDIDTHDEDKIIKFTDYMIDIYGEKFNLNEPMIYKTHKGFHIIFFKLLPFHVWASLLINDKVINKYVDEKFIKATFVRNGNVLRMSPIKYKQFKPHRILVEGDVSDIELKPFYELIIKIINEKHKI